MTAKTQPRRFTKQTGNARILYKLANNDAKLARVAFLRLPDRPDDVGETFIPLAWLCELLRSLAR